MAKPVKSIWTVTFDLGGANELVLVEPDLLLEDEIGGLGARQEVEAGDYIEADDSEPLAYGKTKRTLKLTVYREHASPAAARAYCFDADLAVPVNTRATLTIAITGGATYTLSNSVFKTWNTAPRRTGIHQTATTYELECGALTLGTPAGPDPVGLGENALNFSASSALLDSGDATADHLEAVAAWTNAGTHEGHFEQATSGERPLRYDVDGLWLPGIAGNYGPGGDYSNTELGASFTLRWDGKLPDHTPAAQMCLVSKWLTTGNQRSWALYLNTDGTVTLEISPDGTSTFVYTSTAALPLTAGDHLGIAVKKSGPVLSFAIYEDLTAATWLSLGSAVACTSSAPFNGTAAYAIGATDAGTADLLEGTARRVAIWTSTAVDFGTDPDAADRVDGPANSVLFTSPARTGLDPAALSEKPFARFDGTDDSLALDVPLPLNVVDGVTVAVMLRPNRDTGTQDVLFCGTNSTDARVLIRLNGTSVEAHVRRTDAEAAATLSVAAVFAAYSRPVIGLSVDYQAGTMSLYSLGGLLASGPLTSAGATDATDSSETRVMAGQGGANPTAGDLYHALVKEEASTPFAMADLLTAVAATSF